MGPLSAIGSPITLIVIGLTVAWWGGTRVRAISRPAHWPRVTGRIVDHERDAARRPVDVVRYPLPEGGEHEVRPRPHGSYVSGRPLGTDVVVWRDPIDPLNAELEAPTIDRFAAQLTVGILGAFFALGGVIWLFLLLALPR